MKKILMYMMLLIASTISAQTQYGTKKQLTIQGSKGKLAAVIQMPELKTGKKCPLVMLLHGFGGSKEGPMFDFIADSLAKYGIASIRFDFNGHGQSDGEFKDMTVPNEIADAQKVYEYVKTLPYVSKIGVLGHSQGGVVASMLAGNLGKKNIKAVVLMAPAAVLRDDAIRGNTMGKSYDPLNPPETVELFGRIKLGRQYIKTAFSLPIYETAVKYQGPALILHGTADRVVPYTYGERYHQIWKKSYIEIMQGCDHGFAPELRKATSCASTFLIKILK